MTRAATHEMERRRLATEKTLARFRNKPFDWTKSATCIHLARFHAINMGHKPPTIPRFRSALGARKALRGTGHQSLESLLDGLFERIAPAFMMLGDLALVPGDNGETAMGALLIHSGGPKMLGWHDADADCLRGIGGLEPHIFGAWRL